MDWYRWYEGYDGPVLSERLKAVRAHIDDALADTEAGRIHIISMCAGQGHDIVGALERSNRRDDAWALLVEWDERNVRAARQRVDDAALTNRVTVKAADAGGTDAYQEIVPAGVILVCGVFGSLTDEDIDRTVETLPTLAAPGAHVIWTANRSQGPELWETALASFARHGFAPAASHSRSARIGVGRHRLMADPEPFLAGRRMFAFADEPTLRRIGRLRP